jgi:hypothetical protein
MCWRAPAAAGAACAPSSSTPPSRALLAALGYRAPPATIAPARAPPQAELWFDDADASGAAVRLAPLVAAQTVAGELLVTDGARALLGTGDAQLIEHTENDDFWGDGGGRLRSQRAGSHPDGGPGRAAARGRRLTPVVAVSGVPRRATCAALYDIGRTYRGPCRRYLRVQPATCSRSRS